MGHIALTMVFFGKCHPDGSVKDGCYHHPYIKPELPWFKAFMDKPDETQGRPHNKQQYITDCIKYSTKFTFCFQLTGQCPVDLVRNKQDQINNNPYRRYIGKSYVKKRKGDIPLPVFPHQKWK